MLAIFTGEHLATETGEAMVQSVTADPGSQTVYNLDVETDHRYFVSVLGVMAHNANTDCLAKG